MLIYMNSKFSIWCLVHLVKRARCSKKGKEMDKANFAKLKLKLKDDADSSSLLDTMLKEAEADESKLTETEGKLTKSVDSEGKLRTYKQSVNEALGLDKESSRDDSLKKVNDSVSKVANLEKGVSDKDNEIIEIRQTAKDALDAVSGIKKDLGEKDALLTRSGKEKSFRAELTSNGIKDTESQDLAVNAHLSSILDSDDAGIKEFTKTFAEKNPRLKDSAHKPGARTNVGGESESKEGLKGIDINDTKARTDAIQERLDSRAS